MAYCPICGTDHDPDLPCGDKAGHVLRRAGISKRSGTSPGDFAELSRKSTRSVIIAFVLLAGSMFLVMLLILLWR